MNKKEDLLILINVYLHYKQKGELGVIPYDVHFVHLDLGLVHFDFHSDDQFPLPFVSLVSSKLSFRVDPLKTEIK